MSSRFVSKFLAGAVGTIAAVSLASPAMAASSATPNPAVPGDEVTLTYTDKTCAADWRNLADLGEGLLLVEWPDGTTTEVDPVTDPVIVTVPAGMTTGTASFSLHKGFVGNGEYTACAGGFTIAEDATVPVADPAVVALFGVVAIAGASVYAVSRSRKETTI